MILNFLMVKCSTCDLNPVCQLEWMFLFYLLTFFTTGFFLPIQIDDIEDHRTKGNPDQPAHKAGNYVTGIMHTQINPADADEQDQQSEPDKGSSFDPP